MPHLMYPPKSLIKGQFGLNLADYLHQVDARSTLKSKDVYFYRDTLRRRQGLQRLSTEDWSAAIFRGAHEFLDDAGNSRLLVGRNGGTVEEIQSAAAHATVISGLTAAKTAIMATGFGATFLVNGTDRARRIDATSNPAVACTARVAGIPSAPTGFAAAAGAAGTRSGDYAFMATAVIEISGVKALESDWSDIVEVTLASEQVDFSWTDPSVADSRVTHVYLYGTKAGGVEPYFIRKVALPATTHSGENTADSALGAISSARGSRAAFPSAPELLEISGTRLVLIQGKTAYFSRPAINAYDLEIIEQEVGIQIPGRPTAMKTIASPGGAINTNSLWVATDKACIIFFGTNPRAPQILLSSETGCIGPEAVVARGNRLFWVDRRRGVMFWPGEGRDIFCISERVKPIFSGGGNQNLTANQGDENITLRVWLNMLLVTVRDDSSKTGPNKVYLMDLLAFERNFFRMGPENAAVWAGPWTGPGWHRIVPRSDDGLTVLDNQNKTILKWDSTTFKDYLGGTETGALPAVRFGPALQETLDENKRLHHFYLYLKHGVESRLRVIGQDGQFDYPNIPLLPAGYSDLTILDDLTLVDITIIKDSGRSEARMDWSFLAPWFQYEVSTLDEDNDWELGGARVAYTRQRTMVNV